MNIRSKIQNIYMVKQKAVTTNVCDVAASVRMRARCGANFKTVLYT